MEDHGGIGVNPDLTVPLDEEPRLAAAVRESVHRQIVEILERRGLTRSPDLIACPTCGDRVILLDIPSTYVFDRDEKTRICAACGAERDLVHLVRPDADVGGEGG